MIKILGNYFSIICGIAVIGVSVAFLDSDSIVYTGRELWVWWTSICLGGYVVVVNICELRRKDKEELNQ